MKQLVFWMAIVSVLVATMMAVAQDVIMTPCSVDPRPEVGKVWSWRTIDDRQCWYEGKPRKPKSELYWPLLKTAEEVMQPGSDRTEPRSDNTTPASTVDETTGAGEAFPFPEERWWLR